MIAFHYRTLGVLSTASADEIRAAYKRLAREHHPDRNGSRERFEAVADAWHVLSVPERRAAYDQAFRLHLETIGAVECPRCGTLNRVEARGQICGQCAAALPDPPAGQLLKSHAARLALDFAESAGHHGKALVSDLMDAGLARLRARFPKRYPR